MVAHVVYSAYDAELPASISPIMRDVIRNDMGYDGVLISDCIFMESLQGTLPERVAQVLDAGFDVALHSHGDVKESEAAAKAARPLTDAAQKRIAAGKARLGTLKIDSSRCPGGSRSHVCKRADLLTGAPIFHRIRKGEFDMKKYILAAAALTMLSGSAMAQTILTANIEPATTWVRNFNPFNQTSSRQSTSTSSMSRWSSSTASTATSRSIAWPKASSSPTT